MILISLAATIAVLMALAVPHPAESDGARCEPQGWIAAASDTGVVTS